MTTLGSSAATCAVLAWVGFTVGAFASIDKQRATTVAGCAIGALSVAGLLVCLLLAIWGVR